MLPPCVWSATAGTDEAAVVTEEEAAPIIQSLIQNIVYRNLLFVRLKNFHVSTVQAKQFSFFTTPSIQITT